jgi:two-component system cell cycle sensor histidine kinase/response regulator CckA
VLLVRLVSGPTVLRADLQAGGGMACIDPVQLDQVIINLVVNARDAMPGGGVVTLRTLPISLRAPLDGVPDLIPAGRYLVVEVEDTGIGVDPSLLRCIFDPFFTTHADDGGCGLGLATVRQIVHGAGGFLGTVSGINRGTIMRVYLPCAGSPATQARPASPPTPRTTAPHIKPKLARSPERLTLLLVDDESTVRQLAERAFVMAGWNVLAAASGQAALDLLATAKPMALDLLVSDVMMPGIDGPTLVALVRRAWPSVPALLLSGYADEQLRDRLIELHSSFLLKPYRLCDLTAAALAATGIGH